MYSIVIPVFKSTNSLGEIASRLRVVMDEELQSTYELVYVNDSPFHKPTCEYLEDLVKRDGNVKVVTLTKNFGQQSATLCGIEHSNGDYIITMDDDLQHLPEDIPVLVTKKDHDIVIGRFRQKKHNIFKRITSSIKGYFDYLLIDKPKHIKMSPFRLFNKTVARGILLKTTPYPFIPALLFSVSRDIVNVQVQHEERQEGKSSYTFMKMVKLFTNLIINNSSLLLRLMGYLGIIMAFLSILGGLFIIYKKLFLGQVIVGWASLMTVILFLGGMVLFTLGVIGEYLVRIVATAERTPTYIVKSVEGDNV